jgi:phosphoribosyl 1,2-cyclic phosphodiesterase
MFVCPLVSGSSGNATYVAAGKTRVLIDCGKSGRCIENCLRQIGVEPSSLTHLLTTHAHFDHTQGLGVFSRKYNLPIYASIGTWDEMQKRGALGPVETRHMKIFQSDGPKRTLDLGDLEATFFSTPHDARDSVGYVLTDGRRKFALATDCGTVTETLRKRLLGADVVLLEANYDYEMLTKGPYSYPLKQRILSASGHLDNAEAGRFAVELVKSGVRRIFLGHLSKENNTPRVAYDAVAGILRAAGIEPNRDFEIYMTRRDEPSRTTEL